MGDCPYCERRRVGELCLVCGCLSEVDMLKREECKCYMEGEGGGGELRVERGEF